MLRIWSDTSRLRCRDELCTSRHYDMQSLPFLQDMQTDSPTMKPRHCNITTHAYNSLFPCYPVLSKRSRMTCWPQLRFSGNTKKWTVTAPFVRSPLIWLELIDYVAYDNRYHLLGTTKILNLTSNSGCSGGLGEAAAWLCLREDIYVSLVLQQPLRTRLDNYRNSQYFSRSDDVSWANRMVFLLARILSCAFQSDSVINLASWQQMKEEVESWRLEKPITFDPILSRPRSRKDNRALPEIWMLAPFHGTLSHIPQTMAIMHVVNQLISDGCNKWLDCSITTSRR